MFKLVGNTSILAGILVAAMVLCACGGGDTQRASTVVSADDRVVARVGAAPITEAAVSHWVSLIAQGPATRALRQHALGLLITAQWLIGEVTDRGQGVSPRDVNMQFEAKNREAFPNGEEELQQFLHQTGETVADVKFKILIELASSTLRELVRNTIPHVTAAQVVRYYSKHRSRFVIPEQRMVKFVERTTLAAATRARRELEAGRSIVSMEPLDESVVRFARVGDPVGEEAERQIFSQRPKVLAGPVRLPRSYAVFVVDRIVPSTVQPLKRVEGSIRKRLVADARRQTAADLTRAWMRKWTARTSCAPDYVIQQCSQYTGPREPPAENPFTGG
jgi:hypothetical protein